MGLWSWITGKSDEGTSARPARAPLRVGQSDPSDGAAVGVLDAPDTPPVGEQEVSQDRWWAPQDATLTELVEMERPNLSTEARALENLLVTHFDGHDLTLPPLLHVAETVLPRLGDRNCELSKVAESLSEDQVIAAGILRMANSPLYRGLSKTTGLKPAITRLGIRALRTLLMHESLRAATFHRKRGNNELAKWVWRRALSGACIMRGLSEFTKIGEEDAFLAGLLHDIGNVVVLRVTYGELGAQPYDIDLSTFEYLCHECHQEFGELIADAWSLPPNLKTLISDHHRSPEADDPQRVIRFQLQLTDMINSLLCYAPHLGYNLLESRPVHELGLSDRADFVAFLENLPEHVEETVESL